MLYEKQRKPEFWALVKENREFSEIIGKIKDMYAELSANGIKPLTREDYGAYFETGDRAAFEKCYFDRRALLTRAFILALLYPESREYINTVQDVISALCDEYNWVVPAHSGSHKVDLFSSETALLITECIYFLDERIDKSLIKKALFEVKRRVINAYEAEEFLWEKYSSNWSAVCSACVAISMMYAFPEALERNIDRIIKTQDIFLSGFSDEGVCFEGASYWVYGFGNFVWLSDALYKYSNGKYNLFDLEKARIAASYPRYAVLCGGTSVSFSDAGRSVLFPKALINCIKTYCPEVQFGLNKANLIFSNSTANQQNYILRNFIFGDLQFECGEKKDDYFLPSAGQMIFNREQYSFAIKAGNNAELHNHNDIGSFIFADADGQALCDLGCGYYNREYFSEKRYEIFCNSSFGHSVPIVDNKPQKAGKDYKGAISSDGNTVTLDIKGAYDVPELERLVRTVKADEFGVTVTDLYEGDITDFTDRFVTLRKPQVSGGVIALDTTVIKFDAQELTFKLQTASNRRHNGEYETVYLLDFKPKGESRKLVFKIEVAVK
ncbi:MAG: heparinase II/III family protein [Clostridia bacterium]|nr:heparinase II/III family protein [Clostridia bacterium]